MAPTPLGDLRVVEISDRIAGGYCGKLLVDAGAEVVKVEPVTGDPLRRFTATGAAVASGADSPLFSYLHAGKRSVTTISDDLLARADIVVVTATRSGALERGVDPARLLETAPQCIVVTVSDFGWSGPWAERAATEFTLQAWSGLTGFRGDPAGPPISIGGELGEYMGGSFAAFGALGLRRRVRRGSPGTGDDNWIAVSVHTDDQRIALANVMGGADTPIADWFATQKLESAVERLAEAGIPVAAVVSPSLVTENPQLRHRGFFESLEHPRTGPGLYPCPPFARLDGTETWLFRAPPTLGQHNIDVLTEMCGVSAAEFERLTAQGVIGTRPKGL
jgi:crotonobetainyl-CoA:carnitine CoA-transferase CaiB-like acyl-CoA transferase